MEAVVTQTYSRRNEYEDLDRISAGGNQPSDDFGQQNYRLKQFQPNQRQTQMLSLSDTAIHSLPQTSSHYSYDNHQSSSLSLGISHGTSSIKLLRRPCSSAYEVGDNIIYAKTTSPTTTTTTALATSSSTKRSKDKLRKNLRLLGFVAIYGGFLMLGALCFQTIERPVEQEIRSSLLRLRFNFINNYTNIKDDDLETFLRAVIAANDRGISPLRNASNEMNWSFGQALFFSSTVITTIGYGRVTPLSQTGKIFCMIYAAIGIPLTLVLINAIVSRLLQPTNWLLGVLNSKLGHLYQSFNIRLMHLCIIVAIILILFFAIPTTIFAYIEPDWGILDALYYCFISLTTIGLGDYIPGDGVSADNQSIYKMCIAAYLITGLTAVMLALTIFYDIPQLNLGQLFTESVNGETEKLRLSSSNATCYSGPAGLYMPQRDEDTRRAVVRIRPHGGDDSPSPDEAPTLLNNGTTIP